MWMSENGENIVGWKKGNHENSNLSSLLISHNMLQEVPEELRSAELLGSIESVYTISLAKMDF